MKRVLPAIPIAILILAFSPTASAWTRASDERIAMKAAQLAPADLNLLINQYEADYKDGLAMAEADEGSDLHHYFVLSRSGRLRERIERETGNIIAMIRSGKPISSVVNHLGLLAHFVADANNPFHISHDDPRLDVSHDDFEAYFERRMAKFPTVFYGLEPNFRLKTYLDETFTRTAKFYPLMSEEYFRFGERRTSDEFDDRSTAFGVASVCYSRAVSDLANIYYYIWREAGGDVRSAPAMRRGNLMLGGGF